MIVDLLRLLGHPDKLKPDPIIDWPMHPRRTIPIAWRNLTENKLRLLASLAGTAFAVTLMFMENGFRNALLESMVELIRHLDGQLFLVSRGLYTLSVPYSFPNRRLEQAKAFPEVTAGVPVAVEARRSVWRSSVDGVPRPIRVVAYPPRGDALDIPALVGRRDDWDRPGTAMADALSRTERLGPLTPGLVSELSGKTVRILGTFDLGADFQSDGTLVMSCASLQDIFPDRRGLSQADDAVTVGLLRVRPGVDLERLRAAIAAALPADVRVLTKAGLIAKEQAFWDHVAPIGTVFSIGVVLGFIVGLVICYQVLFSEISERLAEFATLKAMGYSDLRLFAIIVQQAVYLALLGYLCGLAVSLGLFGIVHRATGLPMDLQFDDAAAILGLTLVMCVSSGCLAARRLTLADPAQLFR
ncbi:MAG TPA: FtsX-like permease family protein [Isosphaeraceae bacterium]|nr:FtsX-like permease family protein [Isosphaeraceae bacterium]